MKKWTNKSTRKHLQSHRDSTWLVMEETSLQPSLRRLQRLEENGGTLILASINVCWWCLEVAKKAWDWRLKLNRTARMVCLRRCRELSGCLKCMLHLRLGYVSWVYPTNLLEKENDWSFPHSLSHSLRTMRKNE